ncbi:MAG: hypothetical protein QOH44_2177 [Actinomycetota bacterium]|nr:hypothetical protein [Actinomycetota bacterium]
MPLIADIEPATELTRGRGNGMNLTRAVLEEHWRASESGNAEAGHAMYSEDAILDYPQSGERFRGRTTIAAQRGGPPVIGHFTVLRSARSSKSPCLAGTSNENNQFDH